MKMSFAISSSVHNLGWRTWGLWCTAALLGSALAWSLPPSILQAQTEKSSGKPLLYEMRTYTTVPGRLDALNARFRDHTMKLFAKNGMKNVIYLAPVGKENTLVYLIAHEDRAAADASWKAFSQDPEWKVAKTASEADGKIVEKVESVYFTPTEYSPMK